MKKYPKNQTYHKLVRDRIPEIIEKNGSKCEVKTVSQNEAIRLLKEKILEEGQELLEAGDLEVEKEMSDILEVIYSLAEELQISLVDLEELRKKRAKERGRFKKRLFLIRTKEGNS